MVDVLGKRVMLDMDAPTLELALTVATFITNQLDCSEHPFITLPRDIAELALAFTNAAIESLQTAECGAGKRLN